MHPPLPTRAILILLPLLTAAAPTTRPSPVDLAKPLWESKLTAAGDKPIISEYYPTEEALVFLTAYDFTRDPRYAAAAARQLDYAHSRETADGLFLTTPGTTTRDYQARQTYNFYLAYRILGDGKYLRWSDACAAALLRTIPRKPHAASNQTHTLFRGDFYKPDGTMVTENTETIDPNQNSEIALAFSLLYHDPASQWFQDPRAKDIAYNELLAAMSIQDPTTGLLSLTEHIPGGDTAYGSYATFSWTWCQLLWRDPQFEPHLRAAAKWLAPKTDLTKDSTRYYPTVLDHAPIPNWEAYFRLPLLWYCHVDAHQFIADLYARTEHPDPADKSLAPASWAYYDLMGIPRSYYLEGLPPNGHE